MPRFAPALLLPLVLAFAGCDQIAVLDGSKAREAEGVAIGSACRQAGRAIEDCFTMNPDAPKASVFAGWKEMNDYMAANKLEPVKPEVPRPEAGKDKEDTKESKSKEEPKKEGAKTASAEKEEKSEKGGEGASAAPSPPGVPVVPATVNIPGLNTGTAITPSVPAPAAPTAPAPATTSSNAPAGSSIALGGQNIPLAVPANPPTVVSSSAASPAGAPPAHH